MEPIAIKNNIEFKDNVLSYSNKSFYFLESFSTLKIDFLKPYDAVILDCRDPEYARIIIKKIRSHEEMEFYLKPVFLINSKEHKDPYLIELSDGNILSNEQIPELINDILQISTKSAQIETSIIQKFEARLFKKILNFMFTRDLNSFKPYEDVSTTIGFCYPAISAHFDSFESSKALDLLEWAEKENLVWPDFVDRIYLCNNCKNGHLSFREVCPSCDSANMISEDLIHHFPCGYIGAISDFKNKVDSVLSCPKCSKSLRHIGVDYDKPSIINHCLNCDNVFQDYLVKAKCFSCSSDTDVQYLVSKNINAYKVTKKGKLAAISGIATTDYSNSNEVEGTIELKTFAIMMHYEQERIKSNSSISSNIAVFHFENIFELYKTIGKSNEKTLLAEFVEIIRSNITPADFICINNASIISICLNDAASDVTYSIVLKIAKEITELVNNNFNGFKIIIHQRFEALSQKQIFEKQLQSIIKEIVERT